MEKKPRRRAVPARAQKPSAGGKEKYDPDPKSKAEACKAQQQQITRGLRRFFDSVAAEPVPKEFLDLLRKMDEGKKR